MKILKFLQKEPEVMPVKAETHSNADMRTYHTNFEISKTHTRIFWRPLRESSDKYLKEVGRKGATLVRRLFRIPGITQIFVDPYSVGIEKGMNFSWDNLEPIIIETITKSAPRSMVQDQKS